MGDVITEIGSFLSPSGQSCHDIVCRIDVVRHLSCTGVNIVDISTIIFLDTIGRSDSRKVKALVDVIASKEVDGAHKGPETSHSSIALD